MIRAAVIGTEFTANLIKYLNNVEVVYNCTNVSPLKFYVEKEYSSLKKDYLQSEYQIVQDTYRNMRKRNKKYKLVYLENNIVVAEKKGIYGVCSTMIKPTCNIDSFLGWKVLRESDGKTLVKNIDGELMFEAEEISNKELYLLKSGEKFKKFSMVNNDTIKLLAIFAKNPIFKCKS